MKKQDYTLSKKTVKKYTNSDSSETMKNDNPKDFREYYDTHLRQHFIEIENRRRNFLEIFVIKLLYYIALNICIYVDLELVTKLYGCAIMSLGYAISLLLQNKYDKLIYGKNEIIPRWAIICGTILFASYTFLLPTYSSDEFWDRYGALCDDNGIWDDIVISATAIWVLYPVLSLYILVSDFVYENKKEIMQKIVKFFGKIKYSQKGISKGILELSQLFGKFNSQESDDRFDGEYNGVNITISEEKLACRGKKYYMKVFGGVIIMLSMNKKFKGHTIILKDSNLFLYLPLAIILILGSYYLAFNRSVNIAMASLHLFSIFSTISAVALGLSPFILHYVYLKNRRPFKLPQVKLEDIKFEKHFDVYSDSQV